MSRSGYSDDCEGNGIELYRQAVHRAIHGKRGQKLLLELAAAMDAMPEKKLITEELVTADGACCTLGVICKARGITELPDAYDAESVGMRLGIARSMAAEIAYENDEFFRHETPEQRWTRMRAWVAENLRQEKVSP